ncbi:MAG: hypothetical protein JXA93_12910 [Anaerolineae bacterium]|nr:hypothetical protein [Anaerolineae bacterium]
MAMALFVALAAVACGFLLRDDLLIYGDHPGQFMRLWYPVRGGGHLLGWNPLWYAGYPELQFYPPGFVMLGWLLDRLTLGQLSDFFLYQALLFFAYLLPAPAVYLLVTRVTGRWLPGLAAGVLGLALDWLWGGTAAIFVGLVAERLAFGLVPLAMLAGWRALHATRAGGWWLLVALLLAAIALMHPFHGVAPVVFLSIVALFSPRRLQLLAAVVGAGGLALALTAFWLVPLAAHGEYAAPMLRADLNQTLAWLFGRPAWPELAAAMLGLGALGTRERPLRLFVAAVLGMAGALVILILFDHLVLIQVLGFYTLDPVRFSAEVYLALLLLAGVGLGSLPGWLAQTRLKAAGGLAGALVAVLVIAWLSQPFLDLLRDQRDPAHFLSEARRRHDLDAAWSAMAQGTGRLLYTSHYLHLDDVPTALKAATPYFARRPIVGGTFSHWSPVARSLWVGRVDVDLLPGQVELTDDVTLAGHPWTAWTGEAFFDFCHRLNVTTVVATWADANARTFLDAAPEFESFYSDDLFVLYRVLDPAPALVEAEGAAVTLRRAEPEAFDVSVAGALPGAVMHVKITDYPLWRVQAGGQVLAHHADELGLMEVPLPPGNYDVTLRYAPGVVEWAGMVLSLIAALGWVAAVTKHAATCRPSVRVL